MALRPEQLAALAEALKVPTDSLLGHTTKPTRKPGPPSRLEQLTEQLAALPRHKQKAVIEILEGYLKTAVNGH